MRFLGRPNVAKLAERGDMAGLERALRHSDESIRREAAKALATAMPRDAALSVLAAQLGEPDESCLAALAGLGASGTERAVEILLVAEDTARIEETRVEAVTAGGTPILRSDPRWRAVRNASDSALGKLLTSLGEAAASTALLEWVQHDREGVRHRAVYALGEYGGRHAVPVLSGLLQDSDQWTCSRAATCLLDIGTPEATKALVSALSHESSLVRATAFVAMGRGPGELTLRPLLAALTAADSDSRSLAAEALGKLGDSGAVPALRNLLENEDPRAQNNVKQALFELDRANEISRIVEAVTPGSQGLYRLDDDELRRVAEALRGASDIRTHRFVTALLEVMREPPPASPHTANKFLILDREDWMAFAGKVGGHVPTTPAERASRYAVEESRYAEYSARVRLRSAAASALGILGDPAAVPALVDALDDLYYYFDEPSTLSSHVTHPLRIAASAALKAIGSPEAKRAVRRQKGRTRS